MPSMNINLKKKSPPPGYESRKALKLKIMTRNKEFVKNLGCDQIICYDTPQFDIVKSLQDELS